MVDWPGLLKWSINHHDGTKPSEFKMMTEENKKFLEAALEEAFGKVEDPNKVMAQAIEQIKSPDRTDASIITALEVIDKCCDDTDCARNCEKLDGIQCMLDVTESHPEGVICARALEILALLFSNNPAIQKAGGRRGGIERFTRLVREAPAGSEVRSKAFRALVALVRSEPELEEKLMKEQDGISVILLCINVKDIRLCEKTASFVRSLSCDGRLKPEDIFALLESMTPLMQDIGSGEIQYRETLSSCVAELLARGDLGSQAMKAAVQTRLDALKALDNSEDTQAERSSLESCLAATS
jgi:hypothetical protein